MRTLPTGLIGQDGGAKPADELTPIVNVMRQTMLAHASEADHADLVITGRGAALPRVRSGLSDALALKVHDFDCSRLFKGADPDLVKFVSPIAMLLGEMPSKPVELLNFRQGEFAFRGRTRGDLTAFYTTFALIGAIAAVFLLHLSIGVFGKIHRLHVLDREIVHIAAPVLGGNVSSDPMAQLRSGIAAMDKQLRVLGGNMNRNSALSTLQTVSSALPHMPAEIEELQVDPSGLRITGFADSFGTVDQVKSFLGSSGNFGAIEVTRANSSTEQNKVEFHLSATFKNGEAPAP
jgi:hypothetical protein